MGSSNLHWLKDAEADLSTSEEYKEGAKQLKEAEDLIQTN